MLLLYRRSIRILFFIFSCPFFWSLRNLCLIVLASHDCPTYHHFGCLWRGGILRIQRQSDAFFYLREQLLASHPDPKQTFVKMIIDPFYVTDYHAYPFTIRLFVTF